MEEEKFLYAPSSSVRLRHGAGYMKSLYVRPGQLFGEKTEKNGNIHRKYVEVSPAHGYEDHQGDTPRQ